MPRKRIIILVPTPLEAGAFGGAVRPCGDGRAPEDVAVPENLTMPELSRESRPELSRESRPEAVPPGGTDVCITVGGVGMAETAAAVAGIIARGPADRPDLVVLAGIAGAYPGSGPEPGDCVVAGSESIADLGAVRGGTFAPLFAKEYHCPLAARQAALPVTRSLTVNCIGGPHEGYHTAGEYGIENMEGAAFFAACTAAGLPFIEVRAVSNLTTDPRGGWRIDEALRSLRAGTLRVITEILYPGTI
ncbi:MAG: hypothetical protein LUD76_08820 [Alistipes sp.]|nr:hypothetical protein [Alistipes sp.]